ncbi:ABC transporter permease [Bacteroides neonati]|uniref:ABC transporter permease n=1 Tax=Bacteroides neonati TaxID=1347393 RepID=UPI0004B512B8|nr:FtsX-like permease family protein [Bacteroides neonati]
MMIRQLLKLIWNQRRQNSWIAFELLLVFVALWAIADLFVVQTTLYLRPLGYRVENCWRLSFDNYTQEATEYESDTLLHKTQGEALTAILDRLRRCDEVEDACVAFFSSPYSSGNTWRSLLPCTADSARFKEQSYHCYYVTPEYFNVFGIRGQGGEALDELSRKHPSDIFVTPELAVDFFGSINAAAGQKVVMSSGGTEVHIAAVTTPIREDDFSRSTAMFYQVMDAAEVEQRSGLFGAAMMEASLRMKTAMTQEQMDAFLIGLGDRLRDGNLYVNGAESWLDKRDSLLAHTWQMLHISLLLVLFILLNVFFGVISVFWLRIEQRRSEIGLRMAMGSTRSKVGFFFTAEGWLLLVTILPLSLIVIANFFVMEIPETYHIPFTWWRLLIGLGLALFVLLSIISLGTWFPASRAMKVQPAEVLRDE